MGVFTGKVVIKSKGFGENKDYSQITIMQSNKEGFVKTDCLDYNFNQSVDDLKELPSK